ncbi:MAG: LPXTG cell wall anchor domain-containing protein [Actinobacteria bacterium]|uniref:Unannotated protein n=1 Tax=freshwater metagenome TaxID=449393 RepID=A0A6J6TG55_9ZZZZ|nr:LPXTG cell wall anchor domain-containing protein [Actinomycetota bacterium]MTB07743.1 LPXTG cell wall anchor domain-containing protein [Actinomycetota bacterium]
MLGSSGDSGLATAAQLNGPSDVAIDTAGNLYIVDSGNNRIRKVTAATGIITTIAGDGTASHTGDDALATGATLNTPVSVSLDAAGNIYIAEYAGNTVRKITAFTGIITSVAGGGSSGLGDSGLATLAELNGPEDAIVDATGNLYISEYESSRIRKVAADTGIITTIAGGGSSGLGDGELATVAELNGPGYITLDGDGNLYVADYNNNRIRKVTGLVAPFTLPPTGASTDGLVWLAAALLGAGVVLVTTRRRHTV